MIYIVLPLFAQSWPPKINKKNRSRLCRWLQFVSKWRPVSAGESLICPCELRLSLRDLLMEQSHMLHVWYIFTYITGWFGSGTCWDSYSSTMVRTKGSVKFPPNFGDFGKQECVATAASACSPHLASAALWDTIQSSSAKWCGLDVDLSFWVNK